jgi:general secretion pathway protein F
MSMPMVRLRYTTLALDGTSATHERDVEDTSLLTRELERQGVIVVSTETLKDGQGKLSFRGALKPRAVTAFLRELSLILKSGLPLAESLDLAAQDADARLAKAIQALRRDIVAGAAFAQALERQSVIFTPDIIAMARVAEATGDYDTVFRALSQERERSHVLLDKVKNTLRYPAFLICAAMLLLLFFLLRVIPQFATLFADQQRPPNGLAVVIFALSGWLVANEQPLLVGAVVAICSGLLIWKTPAAKGALLRGFAKLPVIGSLVLMRRSALLLSNLSLLLGQGVPLIEALSVAESIIGTDAKVAFGHVQDVVRRGGRLNEGLAAVNLLPKLAVRMLKIGEETGELAKTAGEAGQLYMEKLERRLEQVTAFIGPVAILFIAGMIGSIMVSIMMAILSVNDLAM